MYSIYLAYLHSTDNNCDQLYTKFQSVVKEALEAIESNQYQ